MGTVVEATRADETIRSEERVERLMVVEPMTTMAEEVSRGREVLVTMELVMVEPALLVVVMATVLEEGASAGGDEEGAAEVSTAAEELGVLGAADVGAAEDSAGVLTGASLEDMVGAFEVEDAIAGVDDASGVDDVPPVPTACLLFGLMPSGMVSAPICAKPKKKESIVPLRIFFFWPFLQLIGRTRDR